MWEGRSREASPYPDWGRQMSKKITVLIDGGHLRSYLKRAKKAIDADCIEK